MYSTNAFYLVSYSINNEENNYDNFLKHITFLNWQSPLKICGMKRQGSSPSAPILPPQVIVLVNYVMSLFKKNNNIIDDVIGNPFIDR